MRFAASAVSPSAAEGDERRLCPLGDDVDHSGEPLSRAAGLLEPAHEPPLGRGGERRLQSGDLARAYPARVEPSCAGFRAERGVVVVDEPERGGRSQPKPLGIGHVQRAGALRPAEPLLPRDRVVVVRCGVHVDRADRLCAVDEDRHSGLGLQLGDRQDVPGRPGDVREREQLRPGRDLCQDRVERLVGGPLLDARDADRGARGVERPEQARSARRRW